ncbi:MAG: Flp pilus assembly complex ATPase component TadA, partial [Synergistaceae bacterium]|nr:Flp pilus assembly complex ATPase component TadA [Synergistaceae bacterium]
MAMRKKLGEILVELGSLNQAQIDEALKELAEQKLSDDRLGDMLVAKGIVTAQQVTEALGLQFMLPVVNVGDYLTNISALNSLPRALMERLGAFPLELQDNGGALVVAISDPLDLVAQDMVRAATTLDVHFALATEQSIFSALAATGAGASLNLAMAQPPAKKPDLDPQNAGAAKLAVPVSSAPAAATTTDSPVAQSGGPNKSIASSIRDIMKAQPKLGDILVQAGAITETQLMDALSQQKRLGRRLGDILVSNGIITEIRLAEALANQLGLPMFTLTRYRPMTEAIRLIPRNVSERLQLIPLSIVEGDSLLIAMANPLDLLAQDEVRILTGRDIKVGITTATEIQDNLERLYNLQDNLEEAIVEVYGDLEIPQDDLAEASADDAPIIQLVGNILNQAVRERASDIHVEPFEKTARVRYRVDGALYTAFDYPAGLHPAVSARMKIMANMDIAERRKPQDGRILIKLVGRRVDLRVSSLPTLNGEKMVLRILDQASTAVGLERLGLENDDLEKLEVFCGMPWGIMLVTGPTGSGKSTTLYSILQKINQ